MRNQVPKMYESSAHWKTTSSRYGSFHSNGVTSTSSSSTSRHFGSPTATNHYSSSSTSNHYSSSSTSANASPGTRTARFLPAVPTSAAIQEYAADVRYSFPTSTSSSSSSAISTSVRSRAASLSTVSDLRSRLASKRRPSKVCGLSSGVNSDHRSGLDRVVSQNDCDCDDISRTGDVFNRNSRMKRGDDSSRNNVYVDDQQTVNVEESCGDAVRDHDHGRRKEERSSNYVSDRKWEDVEESSASSESEGDFQEPGYGDSAKIADNSNNNNEESIKINSRRSSSKIPVASSRMKNSATPTTSTPGHMNSTSNRVKMTSAAAGSTSIRAVTSAKKAPTSGRVSAGTTQISDRVSTGTNSLSRRASTETTPLSRRKPTISPRKERANFDATSRSTNSIDRKTDKFMDNQVERSMEDLMERQRERETGFSARRPAERGSEGLLRRKESGSRLGAESGWMQSGFDAEEKRTSAQSARLKSGDVTRKKIIGGSSSATRPPVGSSNQDNGTTRVRRTTTGSTDVGGSPTAKTSILRGDHNITKPISSFNGTSRFSPSSTRGISANGVGGVSDSNGVVDVSTTTSAGSPSAALARTKSYSDLTDRFGDKLRINESNADGYQRSTKASESSRGGSVGLASLRRDSSSDYESGVKNGPNDSNGYTESSSLKRPVNVTSAAAASTIRSSPQRDARSLGRSSSKENDGVGSKSSTTTNLSNNCSSSGASSVNASHHALENCGLKGLRNLGNTCFMNSVIQCLSNTRPLLEFALNDNYAGDVNKSTSSMKGQLMNAFAHLLQDLWKSSSSENYISPSAFKSAIAKFAPRFTGYAQQDAQEFLRYLLQGLAEDVNRVTSKPKPIIVNDEEEDKLSDLEKASLSWKRYLRYEDSRIGEIFVGQLKSTLKCTTCGYASVTFDPFWDLSLPLPKSLGGGSGSTPLHSCMSLFTKEEILDGDERPKCSRCKQRRRCTKSFSIQKFPRILVLHLKRFAGSSFRAKLSTLIDFPHTLDLSDFAAKAADGSSSSSSLSGSKPVYNLYAVSNHSGSTHSGHYTAYCKHPYSSNWSYYNDSRVSKHSKSGVCSAEGYVLFYEQAGGGGGG